MQIKKEISVQNSRRELQVTPKMVDELGVDSFVYELPETGMLPYRQYVSGTELPGPFSLLVFLHGVGSAGTDNFLQLRIPGPPIVEYCNTHQIKTILLFPQCPKDCQWVNVPYNTEMHQMPKEPSIHMKLVIELLKSKLKEFDVDPQRIYAGGLSMGGFGAWDLISRIPELFAAALTICGGADTKQAEKLKNIAIFNVHGEVDKTVLTSRSRDIVKALQAAGSSRVIYHELPNVAHNAWDWVFNSDNVLKWLFSQNKN